MNQEKLESIKYRMEQVEASMSVQKMYKFCFFIKESIMRGTYEKDFNNNISIFAQHFSIC